MKRIALMVAVAALCVAGAAEAQERGGLIGSGTRTDDSGQMMGSGNAAGQTLGSGGFTTSSQDSGPIIGSGTRAEETSPMFGSGGRAEDGGFLGSGNSIRQLRLSDDLSLLVVSSDKGTFIIPIAQ
ncbi:MAG TPA: hypothetical protein VI670_26675 [Thermoanaerobaculia bacterium]|jgi:hypothetical protein